MLRLWPSFGGVGNRLDFRGKSVLLTGASSGIGEAAAKALARQGARLLLTGRSQARLERVAEACAPTEAFVFAADLSKPEDVARLAEATRERFSQLDLLIHNAGVGLYRPSYEADQDEVRTVFEVNYFAPVELTRRLLPSMPAGSVVVTVSSVGGLLPLPWQNAYSSSKHALNGYTYCLRMELAGSGVGAVCFCPCFVETPFRENSLAGEIPKAVASQRRIMISAEKCAEDMLQAIRKRKRTAISPWNGWLIVWLSRLFPRTVERRMAGMNTAGSRKAAP